MNIKQLPVAIKRQIPNAQLPVNYVAASRAIAECARIDECKDWSDKAAAIAVYAKQIGDKKMRDNAMRIRVRAKVRIGELLLEIKPARGNNQAPGSSKIPSRFAITDSVGMGRGEATLCVSMARVPAKDRERLINAVRPVRPTELASMGYVKIRRGNNFRPGVAYMAASGSRIGMGLQPFSNWTSRNPAAKLARQMSADEADKLRAYITLINEWLDEFEQHLPKAKPARKSA